MGDDVMEHGDASGGGVACDDCVMADAAGAGRGTLTIATSRYCCYVLRSVPRANRTYVGITIDMGRRVRQHNGELSGGARATRTARPWRVAFRIDGFADDTEARRFEWSMHHPRARRIPPPHYGVHGRLHCAYRLMQQNAHADSQLSLVFYDHNSMSKDDSDRRHDTT